MSTNSIKQGFKSIGRTMAKNSPYILTGLGCGGVLATAVFTGKAVLTADRYLRQENIDPENLTVKEHFKETWRFFVPPVVMGAVSVGCIIGSNAVSTSRNASLAALYSLSETALQEYKNKVAEEIGKNKEMTIRNGITQDHINTNSSQVGNQTVIITGNGDMLCYDMMCDRLFRSSAEKIRQAVLDLNYSLMEEMWMDLNDLYYSIGLPSTDLGNKVGFDIDKGRIEVEYSSHLTPDGVPCLAINANVQPNPKYF